MITRNQEIIRGDQFSSEIYEILDSGGAPINLTGWTFTSNVKVTYSDTDAVFSFTIEKVDAAAGLIRLRCYPADTEGIMVAHDFSSVPMVYDVQMTNDADATEVYTPIGGKVTLKSDVTR